MPEVISAASDPGGFALVRYGVPALMLAFVVLAVLLPMVRLYVRDGRFGFVGHRGDDPLAASIGLLFVALVAGAIGWSGLLAALGPATLGVLALPLPIHAAGLALMAAGIGLCMVAQAQMGASWRIGIGDERTELVHRGLYRWSRHPIYSALVVYVVGVVIAAPSLATAVSGAATVATIAVQARIEERWLLGLHGEVYRDYARRVGRFVPWLGRL